MHRGALCLPFHQYVNPFTTARNWSTEHLVQPEAGVQSAGYRHRLGHSDKHSLRLAKNMTLTQSANS